LPATTKEKEKTEEATPEDLAASVSKMNELLDKKDSNLDPITRQILERERDRKQRRMTQLNKGQRQALEEIIQGEAGEGFKVKIATKDKLTAKPKVEVQDPRAKALMEGAKSLGVSLEENEIITIRRAGGGVDLEKSEKLCKQFAKELKELGGDYAVVVTTGGGSGPRGDIPHPVGTKLYNRYLGKEYEAEFV
jgi:hypothetical protein